MKAKSANKMVGKDAEGTRHFFPTLGKVVVADDIETARKQVGVDDEVKNKE